MNNIDINGGAYTLTREDGSIVTGSLANVTVYFTDGKIVTMYDRTTPKDMPILKSASVSINGRAMRPQDFIAEVSTFIATNSFPHWHGSMREYDAIEKDKYTTYFIEEEE